jgi:K+-sensing histidine kinase KdpD
VTIEVSPLPEQQVRFQISDNGLTLSPEQLTSVWRPYYQGEKYFTGEARGMGLGLSIVASLVWGVGGTCHIYNRTDGPGVTVELKLPLAS